MSFLSSRIMAALPDLPADLRRGLVADLREFARRHLVGFVVARCARFLTKAVDGLVKVLGTWLAPEDARNLAHGTVDEFYRQLTQLAEGLSNYAEAALAVVLALRRGEPEVEVNVLRAAREQLRRAVETEFEDAFTVLIGGKTED